MQQHLTDPCHAFHIYLSSSLIATGAHGDKNRCPRALNAVGGMVLLKDQGPSEMMITLTPSGI